jgi:Glycine zipper 2TM domain
MRGNTFLAAMIFATAALAVQPAAAEPGDSYHDRHVAQQQQCTQRRQGNTAGGAILGGILGAVLGSQAAARGHRSDGSLVGGVVGAAAGAAIGNSSTRCNAQVAQGQYDPYYGQPQQGPYRGGSRDEYGLEGGPGQQPDYRTQRRDGGQDCRWGEQTLRDPDGYEYRENVYMCRGRDGVWRQQ